GPESGRVGRPSGRVGEADAPPGTGTSGHVRTPAPRGALRVMRWTPIPREARGEAGRAGGGGGLRVPGPEQERAVPGAGRSARGHPGGLRRGAVSRPSRERSGGARGRAGG